MPQSCKLGEPFPCASSTLTHTHRRGPGCLLAKRDTHWHTLQAVQESWRCSRTEVLSSCHREASQYRTRPAAGHTRDSTGSRPVPGGLLRGTGERDRGKDMSCHTAGTAPGGTAQRHVRRWCSKTWKVAERQRSSWMYLLMFKKNDTDSYISSWKGRKKILQAESNAVKAKPLLPITRVWWSQNTGNVWPSPLSVYKPSLQAFTAKVL